MEHSPVLFFPHHQVKERLFASATKIAAFPDTPIAIPEKAAIFGMVTHEARAAKALRLRSLYQDAAPSNIHQAEARW